MSQAVKFASLKPARRAPCPIPPAHSGIPSPSSGFFTQSLCFTCSVGKTSVESAGGWWRQLSTGAGQFWWWSGSRPKYGAVETPSELSACEALIGWGLGILRPYHRAPKHCTLLLLAKTMGPRNLCQIQAVAASSPLISCSGKSLNLSGCLARALICLDAQPSMVEMFLLLPMLIISTSIRIHLHSSNS